MDTLPSDRARSFMTGRCNTVAIIFYHTVAIIPFLLAAKETAVDVSTVVVVPPPCEYALLLLLPKIQ
jgi:hypothetical protein